MKKLLLLVVLAVMFIATPVMAKEGFYLGGYLLSADISGDSTNAFADSYISSLDPGAGVGIRLGAGLNRYLSLEGSYFLTTHTSDTFVDQDLTGATLDLKLSFPLTGSNFEPYILAGFGSYELGDSSGNFSGSGTQFGFGADIYLAPELSLNAGLTIRTITFDSNTLGIAADLNADVTTLDVGLTYHFL